MVSSASCRTSYALSCNACDTLFEAQLDGQHVLLQSRHRGTFETGGLGPIQFCYTPHMTAITVLAKADLQHIRHEYAETSFTASDSCNNNDRFANQCQVLDRRVLTFLSINMH